MAEQIKVRAVGDDVPMVDGAIAVGEDLTFQRRWWRFERGVWIFFVLVIIADLSGILGRGPLAKAERRTQDGSLQLKYERVERANTSSIMTILPGPAAIHNGKFQVYVSDSILKQLGSQRVIPQPESSAVGNGGVTYTFPATALPMTVQIELKPSFIGTQKFTVAIPGDEAIDTQTFVLP